MSRRPDVLRLFRRCRLPPRRGPSYWRSRSSRRRPKPRDEGRRACAILGWLRTASGSWSRLPRTIAVPGNQRDWIRLAAADRSEKFSVAFGIRVRSRRRLPFADFHGRVAILATGTAASARGAGRPANQGHLFETGSRPTIYIDRRSTLKVCTTPDTQGNSSADFLPVVLHRRGHQKTCPRDRLGAALHTNSKPAVERHGRSLRPHDEARLCPSSRPSRTPAPLSPSSPTGSTTTTPFTLTRLSDTDHPASSSQTGKQPDPVRSFRGDNRSTGTAATTPRGSVWTSKSDRLIGIRHADFIRASGHAPCAKAGQMTATCLDTCRTRNSP